MGAGNLTTLPHLKDWLGIDQDNTDSDAFLTRLIRAASAFCLSYMQRSQVELTQYDDTYDGYGNEFILLRQYPVTEVLSLSFNGHQIHPAQGNGVTNPYTNGWVLEEAKEKGAQQRLSLFGRRFPRGRSLVTVSYKAGFLCQNEDWTIPEAPGPYTVTAINTWLADEGVTDADGNIWAAVPSSPGPQQYSVDKTGLYSFNAGNAGADIGISYSYVPPDIEQAAWEMAGERYKYMDRIGTNTKSLGGQETVSFSTKDMSDYIETLLNPYIRVTPV